MGKNSQVFLEAIFTCCGVIIHALAPVLFYASWVVLILIGQILVRDGSFSRKRFFFAVLVGAPIGVLSSLAVQDYFQTTFYISAMAGCAVAIMAEQILNGDILKKVSDALISKIGGR